MYRGGPSEGPAGDGRLALPRDAVPAGQAPTRV